ncbi:MAG TPA: Hsp20/alpha crystallin family protein [Bauldia sp.]|nr:Hsp20/alpha crystallin family protein [Bauldia sp.]
MADTATKLPVTTNKEAAQPAAARGALETLRREIDRVFDDFPAFSFRTSVPRPLFNFEPLWRNVSSWGLNPAVDIAEKDGAYEVTVELPGMNEKNIEVMYSDGMLTIKGDKEERKEEKEKDYHLAERRYGSFERSFTLPSGINADKVEASFKNGVLAITLPKSPEAQKKEKKIAVTAK